MTMIQCVADRATAAPYKQSISPTIGWPGSVGRSAGVGDWDCGNVRMIEIGALRWLPLVVLNANRLIAPLLGDLQPYF